MKLINVLLYWPLFLLFVLFICPVFALITIMIYLTSGYPIFYIQKRTGYKGKPFDLFKFRTMVSGADSQQIGLKNKNEAHGPVFKILNDPRFSGAGKFLSHTGLDELPQLINVLKGDMGLIGPRPLPLEEAAKLKPWQQKRHSIKPGIISPWIVSGYHSQSFDNWMKSDLLYIKNKNIWLDTTIVFKTIYFVIRQTIQELFVA